MQKTYPTDAKREVAPASPVEVEFTVSEGVTELFDSISALETQIVELYSRLTPILSSEPDGLRPASGHRAPSCELASQLIEANVRLSFMVDSLHELRGRIAL